MNGEELNAISRRILDAAYAVHNTLGPGLLENAYCACFEDELRASGLQVVTEVAVPVVYRGRKLAEVGFRMDFLVEGDIILEIKAVEAVAPVHIAQLVSYLKLANKRLGFLINFNTAHLREGIHRRVNGF
jgi:GxxExxY protein